MKKITILILTIFLIACSNNVQEEIKLPTKEKPESTKMTDSPLSSKNIDEYLFIDDVMYVDTRYFNQFINEGHIAGFINISFHEMIATFEKKNNVLFTMNKIRDNNGNVIANVGDIGSFKPNYEESIELLKSIFPIDKQIVFIASAGVESSYMMNLLIQYGYDASKLYNAGAFSNSLGNNVAYRDLNDKKYYVEPIDVYEINFTINWGELTPIE